MLVVWLCVMWVFFLPCGISGILCDPGVKSTIIICEVLRKEHLMCFTTIYCYFAIPCILYGHSCLTWMGYCGKMKKESYFLKTWNHFSFITRSHGQMTLLCSGSLIYWLQHVSALQELFHSWSFSAGSICCTTELCNESSAAGAPCCDLNAPCGWEGSEGWEKRAEQSRT